MADRKISELTNITGANLADDDEFALVDTSADETKAITFGEFKTALDTATGFVRITGDTMTGNLNIGLINQSNRTFFMGSGYSSYFDIGTSLNSTLITSGSATSDTTLKFRVADGGTETTILDISKTGVDVTGEITFDGGTTSDDLSFGDNDKAIFGAGSDLQIYHDGSNSFIEDTGTGDLNIRANDNLRLQSATTNENFLKADSDGAVTLYHNNIERIATTSTGIDVTGTLVSDGLTVDGNGSLLTLDNGSNPATLSNTNGNVTFDFDTTNAGRNYTIQGNNLNVFRASNGGDISFYEDTGTTAKFFWDASAESLGIGTSSPSASIHAYHATTNVVGTFESGDADVYITLADNTTTSDTAMRIGVTGNDMHFSTSATERLRIDSSGNVGIGNANPSYALEVGDALGIYDDNTSAVVAANTGHDLELRSRSSQNVRIVSGGSEAMRIDSSGNVLIKTASHTPTDTELVVSSEYSASGTTDAGITLSSRQGGNWRNSGIFANGDALTFTTGDTGVNGAISTSEKMRIDSSGNVNIGLNTGIPTGGTSLTGYNTGPILSIGATDTTLTTGEIAGSITFITSDTSYTSTYSDGVTGEIASVAETSVGGAYGLAFYTGVTTGNNRAERVRIDYSGNVGIGTSSPSASLTVTDGTSAGILSIGDNAAGSTSVRYLQFGESNDYSIQSNANSYMRFYAEGSEAMRIDSSGNLLVGKTSASSSTVGFETKPTGFTAATRDGNTCLILNRLTSDGTITELRKDGTTVGSIGNTGSAMYIGSDSGSDAYLLFTNNRVQPCTSTGADRDNIIDLGITSARFDDIYATNGTIQTSDRNEKQDIAELTEAEQRVAVAAKGLLRKFRWKDAVAEKGDEARTHFGIIAQDLQAAFVAEGLDAGDYAMFISSTWTDEETGEERTRMGVRYSELLAFIIAAI